MQTVELKTDFLEPFIKAVSQLSKIQRLLISFGSIALIVAVFVFLFFKPNYEKISALEEEYSNQETRLLEVRRKAMDLARYEKEMEESEARFKITMKALPDKKEIPSLLANVSQSGQTSDLDFLQFQPKPEINQNFFAEIPVKIKVSGNYHNFALFFDKVSRLNRIVNIKDISINKAKKTVSKKNKDDSSIEKLRMECMAVTYKFIEPPSSGGNPKDKKK